MSIFDKKKDRTNTSSQKWEKYQGQDVIPMWVADSDYETAPEIIEALKQRVDHGVFGYSEQPTQGVQSAIKNHLQSEHNWNIEKDWIVPLPSIVSGLNLSTLMVEDGKTDVLISNTIYPPFKYVVENTQHIAIKIPMRLDTTNNTERWILDFENLENSITPKTQLILFCNPHNPAGTVYTKEELTQLHEICERHNLLICSDEIHCDLILDQNKKHIPISTLNDDAMQRTITLMAASKTFNIAGLGFGFAIIPNQILRDKFKIISRQRMPDINILAQTATEAAFNLSKNWHQEQIKYLRHNRDYLMTEINAVKGLKMYPLEATFLAWIDVSELQLEDPESFFVDAGVGISAGNQFGDNNFIRLNFACSHTLLEKAVGRIKKAINNL